MASGAASVAGHRRTGLAPIADRDFGYDQARHLLWRAGFGGTPDQIQALAAMGPRAAVDLLVEAERVPAEPVSEDLFDGRIMAEPTPEQVRAYRMALARRDEDALARLRIMRQEQQRDDRRQMQRIRQWWLRRLIESPRPLEEKMTLFWHGHFATSYRTIENSYHMFLQNMLFRRHALGNYGDLLFRIIRDPAMLAYLDNNNSRRGRPNENLARELMELFSLGVGHYTEADIRDGARALTGYTFRGNQFVFDRQGHDDGPKRILGRSGPLDGDAFVAAILEQRACSRFMARRLYAFFAAELPEDDRDLDPPTRDALADLAATMLRARYEVRPVLRRLFLSEHFYSPPVVGSQIKSPVVLVVGAVRSLRTPVRDLSVLLDAMDLMGQALFFPPSVRGWEGGRSWINTSTLFARQNTLVYLLTGRKPDGYDALADRERYDPTTLLEPLVRADPAAATDPDRLVPYLLRFTLGQAPPHARQTLTDFIRQHGARPTPDLVTALLLLITAMPEYQLC